MSNFFSRFLNKKESVQNIWEGAETRKISDSPNKKPLLGLLLILLIFASVLGYILFSGQKFSNNVPMEKLADVNLKDGSSENKENLPTLKEINNSEERYQSENFQISYISLGGDAALAMGDSESLPIEVFGVKTSSFLDDKDRESKIVVSWKSNKMTVSEVVFSLSGGGGAETVKEDDFGFSHNVTLSSLEPGSAYIFSIKSSDRWGNSQAFGYYGAYSSAKADSIFELIGKTFGETFGWAMNK